MKFCYIVSIIDSTGKMVQYTLVDTSVANAIAYAQSQAGVSHDPATVSNLTLNGIDHVA